VNLSLQRACALCGVVAAALLVLGAGLTGAETDGVVGRVIISLGAALVVPWSVVVARQLARAESGRPVLAVAQCAAGVVLALGVILVTPVEVPACAGFVQAVLIAVAILRDRLRPEVFPRWAGYLNLGLGLLLLVGAVVPWPVGPAVAAVWLTLNSYLVLGAIRTDRPDARATLFWWSPGPAS